MRECSHGHSPEVRYGIAPALSEVCTWPMSQLTGRSPHSGDPSVPSPAKGLLGCQWRWQGTCVCRVLAEHGGHAPTVVSSESRQEIETLGVCSLKDTAQQEQSPLSPLGVQLRVPLGSHHHGARVSPGQWRLEHSIQLLARKHDIKSVQWLFRHVGGIFLQPTLNCAKNSQSFLCTLRSGAGLGVSHPGAPPAPPPHTHGSPRAWSSSRNAAGL